MYRYYSDNAKMASFLGKATNQIIANCKAHIVEGGKLWEQSPSQVLASLDLVRQVHSAYIQAFRSDSSDPQWYLVG